MSINFDNLDNVNTVNSRTNYDLRFSGVTGKFTLSEKAYTKYDINNNGFQLLKDGDTPVLKVVSNENADTHPGRSGASQKGKTFTADTLAFMLDVEEGDADNSAEFTFVEHENEEDTYLTMERMGEEEEEESIVENKAENEEDVPVTEDNAGAGHAVDTEEETPSWV